MDKLKKVLKIVGLVVALAIVAFIAYGFYINWQIKSGNLVKANNRWYTKAEWDQYLRTPNQQYVEIPAINTPEEVYTKFREALLKNDFEGALNEMRPERREAYREAFKDQERLDKLIKTMPEKIENINIKGNSGVYQWDKKDGYFHGIYFEKGAKGIWKIDSI